MSKRGPKVRRRKRAPVKNISPRSAAAKKGWIARRARAAARSAAAKKGWITRRARAAARSETAKRGWETRKRKSAKRKRSPAKLPKKIARALRSAKRVFAAQGFGHNLPGWEPTGGWQGDALAEEISYMTHEEKIDWLEWLAEQLDTTIAELFEQMGY